MSMRDSTKQESVQEVQRKDAKGVVTTAQVKVITRTYPCRPQVIERKNNWVKFGRVRGLERGENEKGLHIIAGPEKFKTDDGEDVNQEIEIAQDLIEMSKKHQMGKQLRM